MNRCPDKRTIQGDQRLSDPVVNPYLSPPPAGDSQHDPGSPATLRQAVRTGQVITLALIQGLLIFAACSVYLAVTAETDADNRLFPTLGILGGIASWFAALAFHALACRRSAVALAASSDNSTPLPEADVILSPRLNRFVAERRTAALIGQAILESGGFLNLVLMLIDGRLLIHLPMAIIAILGIAWLTPSVHRIGMAVETSQL